MAGSVMTSGDQGNIKEGYYCRAFFAQDILLFDFVVRSRL
jgi:hypothetical protein